MANRKERIAKGIALLDKEVPGWCERVDIKVLDLGSPFKCVLGQVFQEEAMESDEEEDGFGFGIHFFQLDKPTDYGFDKRSMFDGGVRVTHEEYPNLTADWRRAVRVHCPKEARA